MTSPSLVYAIGQCLVSQRANVNIVFLDVDGVLNTHKDVGEAVDYIDPKKLRLFALMVRAVDAKIVISSTWRHESYMLKSLENYLANAEILDRVIGCTPKMADGKKVFRHHEIKSWLDQHPEVTRYAIIDDIGKAANQSMKKNFFLIDGDVGITSFICNKVIEHFRS